MEEIPSSSNQKTKLSNKYAFWFEISTKTIEQIINTQYISQIKKISEFETLEDFWAIYQHLTRPDDCIGKTDLHLFKDPIKPIWNDDLNKNGGKLILKCNKDYTSIIWEEMILGLLSGKIQKEIYDKINGISFFSKKDYNSIEIWSREYNEAYNKQLGKSIRELIEIPKKVNFDIQRINNYSNDYKGYGKGYNNNYNRGYNQNWKYQYNNNYNNYYNNNYYNNQYYPGYQNYKYNNYKK